VAQAIELTTRAGLALGEFVAGEEPSLLADGQSLHYMGTVRMGQADDGASVCDSFSRVWGMANLYVGGNGVIPTATACNPTLTSVAFAVRSARRLAENL
jgi:choline dehydrogenase-like flavoprotein